MPVRERPSMGVSLRDLLEGINDGVEAREQLVDRKVRREHAIPSSGCRPKRRTSWAVPASPQMAVLRIACVALATSPQAASSAPGAST